MRILKFVVCFGFLLGLASPSAWAYVEEDPFFPGAVMGTSTSFALTNSEYFNVSVESTEFIDMRLESVPSTISLDISSSTVEELGAAPFTVLTLGGLTPSTTFYLYKNSYTDETAITTDSDGRYAFTQDISRPYHIWIQPSPSTMFVGTSTTLTSDIVGSIEITASNVVLDCAGHSIIGAGSGIGILVSGKSGVTIQNCVTNNFTHGIYLFFADNSIIRNNSGSGNFGVWLGYSSGNTLTGNNLVYRSWGVMLGNSSNYNSVSENTVSNSQVGLLISQSRGNNLANNVAIGNSRGISTTGAADNTISNNVVEGSDSVGIALDNSIGTTLNNNTVSRGNNFGVMISRSPANIFGNTITQNIRYGIYIDPSNSVITDNIISNNGQYGIYIVRSPGSGGGSIISRNTITNNGKGIALNSSMGNQIYNNYFSNIYNTYGPLYPGNFWNISKTPGTNIIGGPYIGGNFWGKPNGTGFSETCADVDRDEICDSPYGLYWLGGNIDQFPLRFPLPPNSAPTASAGGSYSGSEGVPIVFDGSGSSDPDGDALQYRWDFDNDGVWDTIFSPNPVASHTFANDYSGAVKLEVSDGELTDTDIATVTVNNASPVVEAGSNKMAEVFDEVIFHGNFTDSGSLDAHTIEWNFGDGVIVVGSLDMAYTFTRSGIYTVTLTVTDSDGGVGTDTLEVVVNNTPPVVEAGSNKMAEVFEEVVFNGSFTDSGPLNAHTFAWDFGDGSTAVGSLDASHTFVRSGIYTVTLTVTDSEGVFGIDILEVAVGQSYAIWGNGATGAQIVDFSGDGVTINGKIHSNGDIDVSGSGKIFNAKTTFVTTFNDSGHNNTHSTVVQVPTRPIPISFNVQDYQPGGAKAAAAQAEGKYTFIDGDLVVSGNSALDGLYYVTGKVKLSGNAIAGVATIIAQSEFEVGTGFNGSNFHLTSYIDDLLFFSNGNLKITGSGHYLDGLVYLNNPDGFLELGGSDYDVSGGFFADMIKITGSGITINAKTTY